MAIFNDFRAHGYNAYLNWMFDNDLGTDEKHHMVWCDKELGAAYMKNAAMSLVSLFDRQPNDPEFDLLIFPILFDMWQGLELQLKAGNRACDLLLKDPTNYKYVTHDLTMLRDDFERKLVKLGLKDTKKNHLVHTDMFVDECKAQNAHFDFARYTRMSDGSEQFYLQKNPTTGLVDNTCVDLRELAGVLCGILDNLPETVNYLYDYISYYGVDDKTYLTDAEVEEYFKTARDDHFEKEPSAETKKTVAEVYADFQEKMKRNMEAKKAKEAAAASAPVEPAPAEKGGE